MQIKRIASSSRLKALGHHVEGHVHAHLQHHQQELVEVRDFVIHKYRHQLGHVFVEIPQLADSSLQQHGSHFLQDINGSVVKSEYFCIFVNQNSIAGKIKMKIEI